MIRTSFFSILWPVTSRALSLFCICMTGSNLLSSALITAGSWGMYDFGSHSNVGQYTHFPGQPQNFVSREITVTPERLLTHRFRSSLLKTSSSQNSSAFTRSSYLSRILILGNGFPHLWFYREFLVFDPWNVIFLMHGL